MSKIPAKLILGDNLKIVDRIKRIDIHVKDGDSITLNDTASDFFREIQKNNNFEDILDALAMLYSIDKTEIIDDALELVEMLQQYGVIRCEYDA